MTMTGISEKTLPENNKTAWATSCPSYKTLWLKEDIGDMAVLILLVGF